jgi:hypothetical protein
VSFLGLVVHWHTCPDCRHRFECRCDSSTALYAPCRGCQLTELRRDPGDEIAAHAMGVALE